MLTVFLLCSEQVDIDENEVYWDVRESPTLADGYRVSMGGKARWVVVRQDIFKGESDSVAVVFLGREDLPALAIEDWDINRHEREYGLGGVSLEIVLDESGSLLSFSSLFGGKKPEIGDDVFVNYTRVPNHDSLVNPLPPFYEVTEVGALCGDSALHRTVYVCKAKRVSESVAA